jgi:hypothetical protein
MRLIAYSLGRGQLCDVFSEPSPSWFAYARVSGNHAPTNRIQNEFCGVVNI